jgi:molybdopterin molybdotransferase
MIAFDEALRLIGEIARPLGRESVPLSEAADRILAAPVVAQVDSPPEDCSAMDGYAVRDVDLPGSLRVVGEAFAGKGFAGVLEPGTCVRIFTGAPLTRGADRVVIQEDVIRTGNRAEIPACAGNAQYIRGRASDFAIGDALIPAGRRLSPRALVTAAGADLGEIEVWRRPRVVVLATGDELAAPGEARRTRERVPESVSYGVAAMARQQGCDVLESRRLRDDLEALKAAAADAVARADVVVVTGGASVGERDFARTMFEPLGLELLFAKVAVKPGKPVWLGRCRGGLVLGLPGNPTSAMVTARLLLMPLLAGLGGLDPRLCWSRVRLGGTLPACGDRETFVRARRVGAEACPIANQDSGAQGALAQADLLIRCRPNDRARRPGEWVEALDF